MITKNPFNITFGIEPSTIISRENEINQILNDFIHSESNSTYIITGARGCGKTVLLGMVSEKLKELSNWIVVDVNPEENILEQLASKLFDQGKLKRLFLKTEFNFSFKGVGFSISGGKPITNVSSFLEKEFEYLTKKEIRVLITIDEVVSNQNVKIFVHEYQALLRNKCMVYLLMTGLYQNISLLQNQKSLTFLYRAPKLYLSSLNSLAIVNSYKATFSINEDDSIELAKLTKGYPYGYQLLGNILFNENKTKIDKDVLQKFDERLYEGSYSIIFEELTPKEKEIILAAVKNTKNSYIMEHLSISKTYLSDYKKTLVLKGIIEDNREQIVYKLPRFKEFLIYKIKLS